jgi:hypothetical protein
MTVIQNDSDRQENITISRETQAESSLPPYLTARFLGFLLPFPKAQYEFANSIIPVPALTISTLNPEEPTI